MVNCAAIGCTNRSKDKPELSFHKIPSKKHKIERKKWLQNIRRDGVLPKDECFYICSEHFEKKYFKRDLQAELTGQKRKRTLTDNAVPTKFSFTEEVCPRKFSIKRAELNKKKEYIDDAISNNMEIGEPSRDEDNVISEENRVEMVEKCVGSEVKYIDKGVGDHICVKSIRTQYNPTDFLPDIRSTKQRNSPKQLLTVKISRPKNCCASTNTDLTFPTNAKVNFFIEEDTRLPRSDDEAAIGDELDASYVPEDGEVDQYSDDNMEDGCDDEGEDDSDVYLNDASSSPAAEPKFLVFWSCLLQLFKYCFTCFNKTKITGVRSRGSLLTVTTKCRNNHQHVWRSQPLVNGYGAGNLLLSASILYSGNTYIRIFEMLKMINVQLFSGTAFYNIQKRILFPVLNRVYKTFRNDILNQCASIQENNLIGDGRCDSPGYSAKYGTYTLMNTDLNKILDFHVVHVGSVENSGRMEKAGLVVLLDKLQNRNISVSTLTTDRHVQIRSFLKKEHPEINHQFDVWHFGKNIKKNLTQAAKRKDCAELAPWIKSVINHLWWCCATCDGDKNLLKEKWVSILFHIQGIHSWDGFLKFSQCQHPPLEKERKWLKPGTAAFLAVESIVRNKKILSDLPQLVKFCHTGDLEVFHSLLNKYCPKRLHFSTLGMIARTQLAILDFNCGTTSSQATTSDGSLRYKQIFSRVTQSWVVKKICEKKDLVYLDRLIHETEAAVVDRNGTNLPRLGFICENIAPIEKPNKIEAIENMRSRFEA